MSKQLGMRFFLASIGFYFFVNIGLRLSSSGHIDFYLLYFRPVGDSTFFEQQRT